MPGGCDVLSTHCTGLDVWLAGVLYVPAASMNLNAPNSSTAAITQAMIVRSLSVNATVAGTPWVSTRATFTVTGGAITPTIQLWVVRRRHPAPR